MTGHPAASEFAGRRPLSCERQCRGRERKSKSEGGGSNAVNAPVQRRFVVFRFSVAAVLRATSTSSLRDASLFE